MHVSARSIRLSAFRQIIQWPLSPSGDAREAVRRLGGALSAEPEKWEPIDPLWRDGADTPSRRYQEFLYFQDFARGFLYPENGEATGERTWRRRDAAWMEVTVPGPDGAGTYCFKIVRADLHLNPIGVALFELEIAWEEGKTGKLRLSDAQMLIDRVRRTYVPFWDSRTGETEGAPLKVCLQDIKCKILIDSPPPTQAAALEHFARTRAPLILDHWSHLLSPAKIGEDWRAPSDDRQPAMSYVSLTGAAAISDEASFRLVSHGDWLRLADADQAGSGAYPYNPDFLAGKEKAFFYDRFSPWPGGFGATRYVLGDRHFGAVGAGEFFDKDVLRHFSDHYARLGFIVQFEISVLNTISYRLAKAVEARDDEGQEAFEAQILSIQKDFLTYTHRFHFQEVTSQIQGGELFERWRQSAGLDRLFEEVRREVEDAAAAIRADQAAREAKLARQEAEAANHLATVATWGVGLGLIVGTAGMNVLFGGEMYFGDSLGEWGSLFLIAFLGFTLITAFFNSANERWGAHQTISGVAALVSALLLLSTCATQGG